MDPPRALILGRELPGQGQGQGRHRGPLRLSHSVDKQADEEAVLKVQGRSEDVYCVFGVLLGI